MPSTTVVPKKPLNKTFLTNPKTSSQTSPCAMAHGKKKKRKRKQLLGKKKEKATTNTYISRYIHCGSNHGFFHQNKKKEKNSRHIPKIDQPTNGRYTHNNNKKNLTKPSSWC